MALPLWARDPDAALAQQAEDERSADRLLAGCGGCLGVLFWVLMFAGAVAGLGAFWRLL